MDLKLKGKRILITGGSKGIGLAAAQAFAEEGCELVLVARSRDELEKARDRIRGAFAVRVDVFSADMSSEGERAAVVDRFPDIDVLVNNAGAIPYGGLLVVDEGSWREGWDLKVFGFIDMTRRYFARMRQRKAGVIVNVIGLAGERPVFDYIAGTTGNAALIAFTKAMGSRSVDDNVRVLGINPTATDTDRIKESARKRAELEFGDPERWQETFAKHPFGRLSRPDEVADVIVFMASERASYVSGSIVTVDGGYAARNS